MQGLEIRLGDSEDIEAESVKHPNKYLSIPVMIALQYIKIFYPEKYQNMSSKFSVDIFETKGYINSVHHSSPTVLSGFPLGPNFVDFNADVTKCAKTGLGSSSGVIVILVKAIFWLFLNDDSLSKENSRIAHALS